MQLTHKIALKPTKDQVDYFHKAAGTSRFVWNWALAKWKEEYLAGQKPHAMALKKTFNAIKYQEYPWLKEMHRDSHAQPFAYLAKAWNRFFSEIKSNKSAHEPKFKKKNRSRDSFYVANDKFDLKEKTIRLPKIGLVDLTEQLRFEGKILGATVSRTASRWFVAIQVDVPDKQAKKKRIHHEAIGVDFGIKAAKDRNWNCKNCGAFHDRDINAAVNLKRLATETALPVASKLATADTGRGMVPFLVGKVTPVRYECGLQDTSGQEKNREHISSHF